MQNSQIRTYSFSNSVYFMKTSEKFGGLSNFAKGFPIYFANKKFLTSEHLYQYLKFPDFPDIQEKIILASTPKMAKIISQDNKDYIIKNFLEKRVSTMRFVLKQKLDNNLQKFGDLLKSTKNKNIVELSYKDNFWGTKPEGAKLIGVNALGRLLMELRENI